MCGDRLYALGRPELAKPLYKISAESNTGSEAELESRFRLRILDGDFAGALAASEARVRRYSTPEAFRDYLSLLHVLGHSADAWQGFSQVASGSDSPQAWLSALVGHRHAGMTEDRLRKWLLQPHIRDAHFNGRRLAPYFAVSWFTTDRTPPDDVGELINQLEWPNGSRISADRYRVERPSLEAADAYEVVEMSALRRGTMTPLPPGTPVRSEFAMFADAYAAERKGNFKLALDRFLAMATRYPIELVSGPPSYALAYVAYAAARAGDPTGVETFVSGLKVGEMFDRLLAKAYFAAMHKDLDAAESALDAAFREKLFATLGGGSSRPTLADYQYAEACEWLFQFTADPRFIRMLLDWVRRYERTEPMQAWAYAMEYQYATDPKDRTRALAMTTYLDPLSDRIKGASTSDRARASAWFEKNNPFVTRPAQVLAAR